MADGNGWEMSARGPLTRTPRSFRARGGPRGRDLPRVMVQKHGQDSGTRDSRKIISTRPLEVGLIRELICRVSPTVVPRTRGLDFLPPPTHLALPSLLFFFFRVLHFDFPRRCVTRREELYRTIRSPSHKRINVSFICELSYFRAKNVRETSFGRLTSSLHPSASVVRRPEVVPAAAEVVEGGLQLRGDLAEAVGGLVAAAVAGQDLQDGAHLEWNSPLIFFRPQYQNDIL